MRRIRAFLRDRTGLADKKETVLLSEPFGPVPLSLWKTEALKSGLKLVEVFAVSPRS